MTNWRGEDILWSMDENALQNFMTFYDWVVVVVYFSVVLWVGMRVRRRQTSSEHYFVADQKIPGWAAGISMFAALLSSFTFIALPGWAYERDWQLLMREAMAPVAVVFCAAFIIPIYRRTIRISAYEYLEQRFGYMARLYGTVGFLAGHFFKSGVVFFALAVAFGTVMGVDKITIILVLGLTTLAFTFVGGIEGVVWTEVIQGGLMLLCGLLVIYFLLTLTDPPFAALSTAWGGRKFKMFDFQPDLSKEVFWVFALFGLFSFLTKYATDQTMVQRYLLAPTLKEAVSGTLIGLACCAAAWLIFFLIGSMLWGFYQIHPERLGAGITKGDEVFPYFIGRELPSGLVGLVLAGLLASAQSTISGDLNSVGACVTSDFYNRLNPGASQRRQLIVGKITVVISGLLMIGMAMLISLYPGNIVEFSMDVGALVGALVAGGILSLFMLGFFTRRVNKSAMYFGLGLAAILTGLAMIFQREKIITLVPGLSFHLWLLPVVTNIITMGATYLASVTFFRGPLAPVELTIYGYKKGEKMEPEESSV